jgi:TonB family protein
MHPQLILFFALATLPLALCAQQDTLHVTPEGTTVATAPTNGQASKVYTVVDQMPHFPGGDEAMYRYLANNIEYPPDAYDAGITGVVYTSFVVQEDGSLRDLTLLRSAHPLLDEEALRVIQGMPNWVPGKHKSEVCCVQFNLPIRFTKGKPRQAELEAQPVERLEPVLTRDDTAQIPVKVEELPQFPGGEMALFKFLAANIRYPAEATDANVSGTGYVTYMIDEQGQIRNSKVLRSPHQALSNEALRVVQLMPTWQPGTQDGRPVKVQYNLPIKFTIMDRKTSKMDKN